jgi:hypothetical protein
VESNAAIKELARTEGVFLGSVYTGKGFAGLLEHIRTGKVEAGSSIAFLHTGDTANLFEVQGGLAAWEAFPLYERVPERIPQQNKTLFAHCKKVSRMR